MEKTLTELILEQRSYLKNTFPKKKAEDFVDALYRLLFNLDDTNCESNYEIEQRLRGKRLARTRRYASFARPITA